MITQTFEPLRPIRAPDDGTPFFYTAALGLPRVLYGHFHWPSRSYWLVPSLAPWVGE